MKQVIFTITHKEIQQQSKEKLSKEQINQVLKTIENDNVLWNNIEDSIKSAINLVQGSQAQFR